MKLKGSYFYTLRENAKDEESTSGNLLVRAGMIKKVAAGIYMYLPMGLKMYQNVQRIVKEEMDKTGAQEVLMPSLIPAEVYETCGRVEAFGSDMFNLHDRKDAHMVLGPTHEELFTIAAKSMVRSYKDLPFTLYQQGEKYRDEPRPRYGLIRVREFIMKDAYSFDRDEESLNNSYKKMYDAYCNIFDRIGIDYKIVRAGVGAMGGSLSEEYQAITDIGEDTVVLSTSGKYAANLEVAKHKIIDDVEDKKELQLVETPNSKTIEEVAKYLNVDFKKTVKALLMNIDGKLTILFIRGDRDLNVDKVERLLNAKEVNFADDALIATSNAVPGFTGPIGLTGASVVVDEEVLHMKNFVVGGNKEGYHYINANVDDFKYDISGDIANVVAGDMDPDGEGTLYFKHGIEIGNLFKLGTHYAKDLGMTYLDENNNPCIPTMGSYGIGVGRAVAATIEQHNDENGMILPMSIAPYKVAVVPTNTNDDAIMEYANNLYSELESKGIDTVLDDRDERPGVKFKDMDLIGIPIRITIGKKFVDNLVEYKLRKDSNAIDVNKDEVINMVINTIKDELK
ncbi:MAG TPA: proline--tRNA ligase [Bacilli bacterium]|nr:proline--tRNA ligase [Bacilli bacterium]